MVTQRAILTGMSIRARPEARLKRDISLRWPRLRASNAASHGVALILRVKTTRILHRVSEDLPSLQGPIRWQIVQKALKRHLRRLSTFRNPLGDALPRKESQNLPPSTDRERTRRTGALLNSSSVARPKDSHIQREGSMLPMCSQSCGAKSL